MKGWQATILVIIIVVLVIISSIAQYKIAISDMDPWIKYWLLTR